MPLWLHMLDASMAFQSCWKKIRAPNVRGTYQQCWWQKGKVSLFLCCHIFQSYLTVYSGENLNEKSNGCPGDNNCIYGDSLYRLLWEFSVLLVLSVLLACFLCFLSLGGQEHKDGHHVALPGGSSTMDGDALTSTKPSSRSSWEEERSSMGREMKRLLFSWMKGFPFG